MPVLDTSLRDTSARRLTETRAVRPLVHCITNRVTINDCANIILAAGGSPIMAEDIREVDEIASISQALVINLGMLGETIFQSMLTAGKAAKAAGVPVILDPVGCGASKLRNACTEEYIKKVKPDIIRGNMSEIRAMRGLSSSTRGVDAGLADAVTEENAEAFGQFIAETARHTGAVISASGAIDIVSDGERIAYIANGHPMLCDVTGTGCMVTALTGAFAGAGDLYTASAAALLLMGLAGERAYADVSEKQLGIGSFRIRHLDFIYTLTPEDFVKGGKLYARF